MRVIGYNTEELDTKAIAAILSSDAATFLHLGRGGVQEDGTLDNYNKARVEQTVSLVRGLMMRFSHIPIRVIWSGGHNRAQDRSGIERTNSEGGAALAHATLIDSRITMQAEEESTSTVENATASVALVPDGDTIVVVTDPLHYRFWKVQFIMWLTFPCRKIVYVKLPELPPNTTKKSVAKHFVSTFITVVGMIGTKRGDANAIQRRQRLLQQLLRH